MLVVLSPAKRLTEGPAIEGLPHTTPALIDDAAELVRVALKHAQKRAVLKWPAKAAPMEGIPNCTHQIRGKTTRYDVFMVNRDH